MCLQNQVDPDKIRRSEKIGLWRVDNENGVPVRFYADAQMDELLGITGEVTPEERLAIFQERIHPDDREIFAEYSRKQCDRHTEIVYRYLHPQAGLMVVRCSGARDPEVTDRISLIGTHRDISDAIRMEREKQAELRLARQNMALRREKAWKEDYYRELLDMQSCGLMAYTLPGHKVLHMNAEALRMYGVKDIEEGQERLGELLSKVRYPDPATPKKLRKLSSGHDAVDYECVINPGTPGECHAMCKTKPVRMQDGELAVITTFLDVSDMVTLRRALRQAEEGSKAKSAFLFAMSHDLRTPMNAILGYADLMEAHWDESAVALEYLQKLKDASRFLLGLIGNVLEVSRIESGKETLHEAPWDLRKLSETLDVLLENEVTHKQLNITRKITLDHPYALCDAVKLREILMNLLSNAVKYTPDGGSICLTVEQQPAADAGHTLLRMVVEDTGIGIAETYLPHLFEAFTRERDSSESGIMGTGLGLRIVKSFVDLMGGSVTVKSSPGAGSRFAVEVPLALAEAPEAAWKTLPETELSLRGRRILLAEDNALNAEIATTVLEDVGMEVELAGDGAIALKKLQEAPVGHYDLILMDIQMPHLNGYQAARKIRALPDERARTTIVAMTANAFEEDRQAAFEAGMDAYVTKPIEPAKLMQVLGNVLD